MSLGISADEALGETEEGANSHSSSDRRNQGSPDRRSQGDPHFFTDGTEVELHGLLMARDLNGHTAEVIGFCDSNMRYRVQVVTGPEEGTIKVVAKKNLKLVLPQEWDSAVASSSPAPATPRAVPAMWLQAPGSASTSVQEPRPGTTAFRLRFLVSREMVQHAVRILQQRVSSMHARCVAREDGGDEDEESLDPISSQFLRLNEASDSLQEVSQLYERAYGRDEDLAVQVAQAIQSYEECMELYARVRSWTELALDEVNITKYSIRRHGIVGTLRQELIEVSRDAAQVAEVTQQLACRGSREGAQLARVTSQSLGSSAANAAAAIANSAGTAVTDTRRQIGDVVEEQITTRLKRMWHLLLTALMLCWVIPMFSLRQYHPFNSVVANLGLVWSAFWVFFPPRRFQHRGKRMAMLLIWPMFLVVMPITLHYWLTHPDAFKLPARSPLDRLSRWPSRGVHAMRWQQTSEPSIGGYVDSEEDAATDAGAISEVTAAQDIGVRQAAGDGSEPRRWWSPGLRWFRHRWKSRRGSEHFGDAGAAERSSSLERPEAFAMWGVRRRAGYRRLRRRDAPLRTAHSMAPAGVLSHELET